jgi:predicted cupin superfamily sugar epimerase
MQQEITPAKNWIDALGLLPHPEGGYFRETYRSQEVVPAAGLPARFGAPRALATGIYYLLEAGDYSAFHRIKADEMLHFYAGNALDVHMIDERGYSIVTLGSDVAKGETLQFTVPAGTWFAAAPKVGAQYSLIGCTVSPGFDFADFEMASGNDLRGACPSHAQVLIDRFPPRGL